MTYKVFASQMEKGQLSLLPMTGAWCCNLPPHFFPWDVVIFPRWCPSSWSLSCCLAPSQQSLPLSPILPFLHFMALCCGLIALSLNLTISPKIWARVMHLCHSRTRLTAETVGKEGRLCCSFSCSPLKHPHGLSVCSFNTLEGPGSKIRNVT